MSACGPHTVVVGLDSVALELAGVADLFQVRPFPFDMSEQGFDLGLLLGVYG
jgi:hypothetical protein